MEVQVRSVDVGRIVTDAGTQIRQTISEPIVVDYALEMTHGHEFPPIVVFLTDDGRLILADGFHRLAAVQRVGEATIRAEVRPGTVEDALWYALGAHKRIGLRLTHADKRRAASIAIAMWPHRSAGAIADQIGVHQTFISDLKRDWMASQASDGDVKSALPPLPPEVIGRDGKTYAATGTSRLDPTRVADAITRLQENQNVSTVAKALKMSTRTVRQIQRNAAIPEERDNTRKGIEQRHEMVCRLAEAGFSSRQIADKVGLSIDRVTLIAKERGIVVHANAVIGRSRKHDPNRIIERMAMDAQGLCADVNLIDFARIDAARLPEWLRAFTEARDQLGAFIRRLQKEQQAVQAKTFTMVKGGSDVSIA